MNKIETVNLTKKFGDFIANDNINIEYKGTIYLILIRKSIIITFYPVSKKDKLKKLKTDFNLCTITDDLKIFMEK